VEDEVVDVVVEDFLVDEVVEEVVKEVVVDDDDKVDVDVDDEVVEEVVVDDDDEVDVVVVDDVVGSVLKNRINIRPEDWIRFFSDFITCRSPDKISSFEFIMFRAYHKYRELLIKL
jgi:hypothetical protein